MAAPASRLLSTGALLANSTLDENTSIAPSKFSTTATTIYAAEFDEVSLRPGSFYFAPSVSQELTVPANAAWSFAGDFTIEGWMYFTNIAVATPQTLVGQYSASNWFDIRWFTSRWQVSTNAGSGTNIGATPAPVNNTWVHVACVRSAGVISLYVGGVATGTTIANATTLGYSTSALGIGADGRTPSPGNRLQDGNITNVRVVNGTALYTANFTPPYWPLTSVANTQLLLNMTRSSSALIDSSPNNFTVTNVGSVTWVDTAPAGPFTTNGKRELGTGTLQVSNEFDEVTLASGSMAFDGTNQFVSVPSSTAVAFDTADFTIECWWYATTTTGINVFDSRTSSTGNGININCTGVTLAPQYRPAGVTQITGSALSLNTWYHLAVVRSSAVTRIYVNGVQSGPTYADTINFTSNPARTGANFNSGGLSTGYITNLRVTKAAVYTSTFTPPQQILPALSSTTWLLNVLNSDNLITDNSTNNFTATNNGTVAWSATGPFNA